MSSAAERNAAGDPSGEGFGHARIGEAAAAHSDEIAIRYRQQLEQRGGKASDARAEPIDFAADFEALAIEQPAGGAFDQLADLEQHLDLHLGAHPVVERLDFAP